MKVVLTFKCISLILSKKISRQIALRAGQAWVGLGWVGMGQPNLGRVGWFIVLNDSASHTNLLHFFKGYRIV